MSPRQPTAPPHVRIFGRVRSFDAECPACGYVMIGQILRTRESLQRRTKRTRRVASAYHAVTSTLRCPACHRLFMVGLLIWPVKIGGPQDHQVIPEDMRPNAHQRAVLRGYASGFYATALKAKGDAVNVYVAAECTCPMKEGGWAPACPVHGSDLVRKALSPETETTKTKETPHDDEDDDDPTHK